MQTLLEKKIKEAFVTRLTSVKKKFPDAVKCRQNSVELICSPSVNSIADNFETHHVRENYCAGGSLELSTYVETSDGRIYGYPLAVQIGVSTGLCGDQPAQCAGWEERLLALGFTAELTSRVKRQCFPPEVKHPEPTGLFSK